MKTQNPAGPFTNQKEVQLFLESAPESRAKNERFYREVRYTRNTCLSMANSSKFFKLKRDGKNLATEEYAYCLMSYFDNSRSLTKLTIPDLKNVLGSISSVVFGPLPTHPKDSKHPYVVGEHIIVAWRDQCYTWELGVIDECERTSVSHLVATNRDKSLWVFPEESIVLPVEEEQIWMASKCCSQISPVSKNPCFFR